MSARPLSSPRPRAWLVVALAAASLLAGCSINPLVSAAASKGETDLSRGIDFDGGELARLDGAWEFYGNRLVGPAEFQAGGLPEPGYVKVPSMWAAVQGFAKARTPVAGVATLRLRVAVPPEDREWAIRLPNAYSAERLFVNGVLVGEVGKVSDDPAAYVPSNGLALLLFRAAGGKLDIVLQVANFSTPMIGTWDSLLLGDASALRRKRQIDVASTSLVSGALLIMGLYHLGLYVLRKKDKTSLLFGIICLFMTVRNHIMGERLLWDFWSSGATAWEWFFRIQLLSAHMTLPLFALFFKRLYPRQVHRAPVAAIVAVSALWAAVVLLAPAMVNQRFLHWFEYFLVAAGAYILGSIVRAAIHKEEGALMVAVGIVVLLGTSVNDVLLSTGAFTKTFYMASYGVFFYIFTQSFNLSMIFSKAFSEVEELSDSLKQKNRELESLHEIDLAIASSMELDRVLAVILEQAQARLGVDAADVLLLDDGGESLSFGARAGFRTDALLHTRLKPGEGFAGKALQRDEAIIVANLDTNAEGFSRSPAFAAEGFFFYAGRRLTVKGRTKGVLELYRRSPFRQYPSWELYFETLAGQAAVALDNSELLEGLRRANEELSTAYEATIEGWAEALELRDHETEGHSRRVTEMTTELARRFGISGEDLDAVRHGALLHDLGKIGIPDAILLKPGPLTPEEFAVMKRHPTIARDLLSRLRFLDRSLDIPYRHHEKWDGTGYPGGLGGPAIPLAARLFAVVDVWDALRSDRPYRSGWPEEKVLAHIASLSGSHFDPEAAAAFIELRRGS